MSGGLYRQPWEIDHKTEVHPSEILSEDPLREATRKERRNLLAVSSIALLITLSGHYPKRIETLGMDFSGPGYLLINAIGVFDLYFLCAFLLYAVPDYLAWKISHDTAHRQWDATDTVLTTAGEIAKEAYRKGEITKKDWEPQSDLIGRDRKPGYKWLVAARKNRWLKASFKSAISLRALFDFALPVVLGIWAIWASFAAGKAK